MVKLEYYLDYLREFCLQSTKEIPSYNRLMIVEDDNPKEINCQCKGNRRILCGGPMPILKKNNFKTLTEYQGRFNHLMSSNYSWINISIGGMLDGDLVFVIMFPRVESTKERPVPPSVNLAGLAYNVAESPNWDLELQYQICRCP